MTESLYQIDASFQSVLDTLAENGGQLTPELEAILALDGEQWAKKAEGYLRVIANRKADAQAALAETKRLDAAIERAERDVEILEQRLEQSLILRGGEKTKVATWTLSLRASESVEVDPDADLEESLVTVKTTRTPNKVAIKAALKVGRNIPGVRLVERQNLQIK